MCRWENSSWSFVRVAWPNAGQCRQHFRLSGANRSQLFLWSPLTSHWNSTGRILYYPNRLLSESNRVLSPSEWRPAYSQGTFKNKYPFPSTKTKT